MSQSQIESAVMQLTDEIHPALRTWCSKVEVERLWMHGNLRHYLIDGGLAVVVSRLVDTNEFAAG